MLPDDVELRFVKAWPRDQIVELYKAGGWWLDSYSSEGIGDLIKGSFAFAVAVDRATGRAVGMGRAISDGVSDAWLQDIVVLKEFRKLGIGRAIISKLVEHCKSSGLIWIGLVAEPGTRKFYEPLGFEVLPGEPMVVRSG
ncbi:MAG: GNAT family N-acetyltransferase [Thermoplasmata archaeon]